MSDQSRIERAANHIDATQLGDGRYAYYADEVSRYYVVDADELAELCDYLDDDDADISRDAYSHWCAGQTVEPMPEGWTPDQTGDDEVVHCECAVAGERCQWTGPRRETVVVEYMPEQYRASHSAANNSGIYPHNGAERIRVERSCSDLILEAEGDWAHIVE